MVKETGGTAFPRPRVETRDGEIMWEQDGMTLRDYFAAQVIAQCQITITREEPEPDANVVRIYAERYARTAYVIADAMLAERDSWKRPGLVTLNETISTSGATSAVTRAGNSRMCANEADPRD